MKGKNMSNCTLAESVLAKKITAMDELIHNHRRAPDFPARFYDEFRFLTAWGTVAYPHLSRETVAQNLRACFPQLNTRWHS